MRLLAAAVAALICLAGPVSAEAPATVGPEPAAAPPVDAPRPGRAERLDTLFETLKAATDARSAKTAEAAILGLWLESGSDTVDLLMSWSIAAMEEKDYATALDFLDRVTMLKPDYAEGWNRRATVHFLVDDYSKSIADIERTLRLEPRHFGALSGLGAMLSHLGENQRAIDAYRQALAIDPFLDEVRSAMETLEKETGRDI